MRHGSQPRLHSLRGGLNPLAAIAVTLVTLVAVPFLGAVECPTPCCQTADDHRPSAQTDECCAPEEEAACEGEAPRAPDLDRCMAWSCCDGGQFTRPHSSSPTVRLSAAFACAVLPPTALTRAPAPGGPLFTGSDAPAPLASLRTHLVHRVILR